MCVAARGLFSSCREKGVPLPDGAWASHCGGFSRCGAQSLGCGGSSFCSPSGLTNCGPGLQSTGSIDMAHRFSCPTACGIFPDQGWNWCPLHWQEDSLSMSHEGSPKVGHFESEGGPKEHMFHARGSRLLRHTSLLHQNLLLAHMHGFCQGRF